MKRHIILYLIIFVLSTKLNHVIAQIPTNIYISEIMYDSPLNEDKKILKSHNNGEFIKLFNPTNTEKNISGWSLLGTNEYEQFIFPANTIIKPNGVLIIAYKDDEDYDFNDYYKCYDAKVMYQSAIIIYNKGEKLELINSNGDVIDKISFGDKAPDENPDNVKVLYADNNKDGAIPDKLNSLHRTSIYYDGTNVTDRGNHDWTFGIATPSEGDYVSVNTETTPIIKPITRKIQIREQAYPIIWFKTKPTSGNLEGTYKWTDIVGNDGTIKLIDYSNPIGSGSESTVARTSVRNYNFNPAISIPNNQLNKIILNKKSNLSQATVIGVWGIKDENNIATNSYMFSLLGRSKEGVLFTKNVVTHEQSSGRTDLDYLNTDSKSFLYQSNNLLETETKYKEQSLRIGVYYMSNKPDNSLWGEKQNSIISFGGQFVNNDETSNPMFNSTYNNYAGYNGYTPELLIFNKELKPKERNIFQTYLAIKYGISLDTTYTSPEGKIMWDYQELPSFNNRITGYSRQDALGLYQTVSTTSYEEASYYSYANDSYDQNNCYRMSSRNKLLVIGSQPANYMNNGSYVIFGDNGDMLSLPSENNIKNYRSLPRKWLLKTNIKTSNSPTALIWNATGIVISNIDNYKATVYKQSPTSSTVAGAVTSVPLKETNGYFSWTVSNLTGNIMIKFGQKSYTLTANSNDYGYKINNSGQIYKIERGIESSSYFTTISTNQRIEIEKLGNIVFLRVDGLRLSSSEITITNTNDINATYYGAISIQSTVQITLSNFRHGGFVDTGNRVELSYSQNFASNFTSDINGVYLIIDRSGSGNFSTASEYLVSEIDASRYKLIFNNVFWDIDGNGKDVFTFGYKNIQSSTIKKQENTDEPSKENYALAYYKDLKDLSRVTVKVYLCEGDPYTLSVFDVSGRSIYRKDCTGSKEEQFNEIQLPYPGFYIVKVTSKSYQYSTKIVSN